MKTSPSVQLNAISKFVDEGIAAQEHGQIVGDEYMDKLRTMLNNYMKEVKV
jgi:hypothetical protein